MENTVSKAKELYNFMGVPFTTEVRNGLENNFKLDSGALPNEKGYFGVKRADNFEHDKWKKNMSRTVKKVIRTFAMDCIQ